MRLRMVAAGWAAAMLLVACTGDDDRPALGRSEPTETEAKPRKGGVLRLGITQLPASGLDPSQARTLEQMLVVDQLYDTLTTYDRETLEPVAGLAERWEVTPDLRQWDFHLRSGVTFANGRPISAADVKYSLERVGRSSSNSDLLKDVTGFAELAQGGAELTGISAPAPGVVRIATDEPMSSLPSLMANPVFGVVPRETAQPEGGGAFSDTPIGSGPFTFRGRDGGSVSLVRAPGSPALVDGIELVQFSDVGAAYEGFKEGTVDWSRVPPDDVAAAADRYGRALFRPYMAELFYAFNLANPKFGDVRFREAIVRAVDRQAIIRAIYDDIVRPIDGLVVEGVPGHQDRACGDRCSYDPARARQLVQEVFGPTGAAPPEVMLDFDEDEVQEKVANAIKSNLADIGVTATLRPHARDAYQDFAVSDHREIFRLGWIAPFPSADAILTPLFRSDGDNNLSRLSVPAIDDQLRAARAEADANRRADLYRQAERTIMEHVPVLPIAQFQVHAVATRRVRALTPLVTGTFDASRVWLAR